MSKFWSGAFSETGGSIRPGGKAGEKSKNLSDSGSETDEGISQVFKIKTAALLRGRRNKGIFYVKVTSGKPSSWFV